MVSRTEEEKTHSRAVVTGATTQLLTVSPGKLGLTVKVDRALGGCTISAIDPLCTFKDQVEIGDRLVTVDGKIITQIADLHINNTKMRTFGVVKMIAKDSEQEQLIMPKPKQQAVLPSSQTAFTTANTPAPKNTMVNPVVTTEKSTCAKNHANNKDGEDEGNIQVVITCPDGSVINLFSDQTNNNAFPSCVVLGSGKHGIPSSSSAVLPQACALRIVGKCEVSNNNSDYVPPPSSSSNRRKVFALELVALGMERCTVLRDGNAQFVTSIAQILTSGKGTTCPSSIVIRNGDVIEPCDREKATGDNNSVHYEFKVEIIARGGSSPTKTGGRDDAAVVGGSSAFAMASRKIDEAATMGGDNDEKKKQDNSSAGAANLYATERPDLNKPLSTNPYAKRSEKTAADPHDVVEGIGETMIVRNPFDFDEESLCKTFLHKPNSTVSFFHAYHKILSKKNSTNANTELVSSVLNVLIDAMSPQDDASRHESVKFHGKIEQFPLAQILEIAVDGNHMELGKRAIECYARLSCQNIAENPSGFDLPCGPTLLASANFPLANMCGKIGWENLEAILVESVELLCKYQKTSSRAFALVEKVEPTKILTGSEGSANLRVFFRMAKVAYEKWFIADPKSAALHFTSYHRNVFTRSNDVSVKLIDAFVDAMSPLDSASRRVPLKEVDSLFPLNGILARIPLVDSRHMELVKRILEGYVWLSSQKVSNERNGSSSSKPRGPVLLVGDSFDSCNLVSFCDEIGWNKLEGVLVDAIEKLCEFDNTATAFALMEEITRASPSRGGNSECSLVCVRLAKLTSEKMLNSERFHANPTATAKLFVTQFKNLEKESSNKEFCESLLNSFVDVMSPRESGSRKRPLMTVGSDFPLKDILTLLVNGGHMELGQRVLEGYVWLSSQRISYYSTYGPHLLETVDVPLVNLCDALGWNKLENVLVESIEKLCKYSNAERAVLLVEKIAPAASESHNHRFRICSEMAKIACDKMIDELGTRRYRSDDRHRLTLYKKLLWLVSNYCPTIAPKFVTFATKLDVDLVLYPLLTDVALRSSSSAEGMKNTLSQLTNHCVELLTSRVSSDPNIVTAWTITNAHLYRDTNFGDFLENQCKQTFDWKVRKSDHKLFEGQLRALINAREIRCLSHQPGYSAYYFKITKLKTCSVNLSALSCSCRTYVGIGTQMPPDCLRHSSQSKRRDDKAKLDALKAYLTPEQLSSQKRKAVDALGADDDDDVVFTGVAGVAETVAKRVKAAEDAGEVIEIL
ncbi:hypothetical protein ACHAXM_009944 [Skeletonema potamos]